MSWLTEVPFAHRGLHDHSGQRPENSIAAFAAALARGFGIDLDVQSSADGVAMVFHDATLERLTQAHGPLCRRSAAALSELRLSGSAERIPKLLDVLELVNGRVPILVEVKRIGMLGATERAVAAALARYPGPFAVMSFSPLTMAWFRVCRRGLLRGVIGGDVRAARGRARLSDWTALARPFLRWVRPGFVAFDIRALPSAQARRIRDAGLPLLAWTVTDGEQRDRSANSADNIIFEAAGAPQAAGGGVV